MEHTVTYNNLIYILITIGSILLGLIYFIFKDYGYRYKLILEQTDKQNREDTNLAISELRDELNETKTNYIYRFDEQKQILHELDLKISNLSHDITTGLMRLQNEIEMIKKDISNIRSNYGK